MSSSNRPTFARRRQRVTFANAGEKKQSDCRFFLAELFRRSSLYKQIKMAPFNRDDGDEDHGLDGTALILLGAKPAAMCGCHSDRRGM